MTSNAYPMPNEFVSPEKKATVEWGRHAAKFIFHNNQTALPLFYNNREVYNTWRKYGLGKQDEHQYKPFLRITPSNADNSHLGAIRWQIKDYASKRVAIVVNKLDNVKYDAIVSMTDPLAIDEKENYKARLSAYIQNKEFLESIGVSSSIEMGFGIPQELMPKTISEAELYMNMSYKERECMQLEMDISTCLARNRYEEMVDRQLCLDLAYTGFCSSYQGLDENNNPIVERLDIADLIVPYSPTGDYSKIPYCGQIMNITVAEFKKMNRTLSDEDVKKIAENQARKSGNQHSFYNNDDFLNKQDVERIMVLRFEMKTTNEKVLLEKPDVGGNTRTIEKEYNYYNTDKASMKDFEKKYGKERKLTRHKYQAVYEGYWIVDTDYIFNYGLKNNTEYPNGPFGEAMLGFKIYSPEYYNGQNISLVSKMIPVLDDLQTYNLKIQETLSQPFDGVIGVDLYAIRKAGDGLKRKMSPEQILEMAYQNKVILFDSSDGKYAPGSNYKPIIDLGMKNDVAKYIQLIAQALFELDEIIGINKASAASQLSDRQGKATTELQMMATDTALDHLFQSKKFIFHETVKSVATLLIQAKKYGDNQNDIDRDITKHTYNLIVEARPTDNDWAEFYTDAKTAMQAGIITYKDMSVLKQMKNLKQAWAYLSVADERRRIQAQEAQVVPIQETAKAQQQSNAQAHANKLEELNMTTQGDLAIKDKEKELEALKHKNKMEEMRMEAALKAPIEYQKIILKGQVDSKLQEEDVEGKGMLQTGKAILEHKEEKKEVD